MFLPKIGLFFNSLLKSIGTNLLTPSKRPKILTPTKPKRAYSIFGQATVQRKGESKKVYAKRKRKKLGALQAQPKANTQAPKKPRPNNPFGLDPFGTSANQNDQNFNPFI